MCRLVTLSSTWCAIRELAEIVGLIADAANVDITKALADKLKGKPISVRLDEPEDRL
jgi:hypothetical protein